MENVELNTNVSEIKKKKMPWWKKTLLIIGSTLGSIIAVFLSLVLIKNRDEVLEFVLCDGVSAFSRGLDALLLRIRYRCGDRGHAHNESKPYRYGSYDSHRSPYDAWRRRRLLFRSKGFGKLRLRPQSRPFPQGSGLQLCEY